MNNPPQDYGRLKQTKLANYHYKLQYNYKRFYKIMDTF